jgi:hypothetical protein
MQSSTGSAQKSCALSSLPSFSLLKSTSIQGATLSVHFQIVTALVIVRIGATIALPHLLANVHDVF